MKPFRLALALLTFAAFALAQDSARLPSIPQIFAEGGITGRAPETVKWSPDGTRVSYVLRDDSGEHGQLYYIDVNSGKPAVLVASEKLASLAPPESTGGKQSKDDREREKRSRYSVAGYHWAPDSKHLLFDSKGQLWYYTLESGTGIQITVAPDPSSDPKFSPDGKRLSYIRRHNLYVRPVGGDSRENQLTTTSDDDGDNVLNGEVDWVYEEELAVRSNYFWSPDGKHIVYLQMNEAQVPEYPITDFIPDHPTVDRQKYPYAGDPNPEVRVGVVDSGGGKTRWVNIPGLNGKLGKNDYYIPRFGWVNKETLYIEVLNRDQNQLDLYFVDVPSGHSQLMLSEKDDAWIMVNDTFRVLKPGEFLWESWRDGHNHLYLYTFTKGSPATTPAKLERQLTSGDFEVTDVEGVDETRGTVFYISTEGDDRQRNLFSIKLDGSGKQRISREDGTHHASFSDDAKYYVDTYSALMTPPRMSLCSASGNCNSFWSSHPVDQYALLKPQFVDFTADDGTVLHGQLLLPPGASAEQKAPVLMNPYGGPEAQTVQDHWGAAGFLFDQILARDGIAVLRVDNRGMGFRGKKFATALRHQFGKVELTDQLTALDQALNRFPQLDANRMGWWGWSYGGFMTSYALTHSRRFKSGVAVAPVTDWHDYDSIYTERYMGIPKENQDGYKASSVQLAAGNLSGHLLVVHGTSDDNVHMQNTMQLAQDLINSGKQFDLLLFPRKTHGIAGTAPRTNLYEHIRAQFDSALLGWPPEKIAESNPPFPAQSGSAGGGR